ncbi:MAG: hypothetical protein GX270_01960 [Clostridiaceae bacterium]|nr:hypothetical protein [Clostridiaceae bacterium]
MVSLNAAFSTELAISSENQMAYKNDMNEASVRLNDLFRELNDKLHKYKVQKKVK